MIIKTKKGAITAGYTSVTWELEGQERYAGGVYNGDDDTFVMKWKDG